MQTFTEASRILAQHQKQSKGAGERRNSPGTPTRSSTLLTLASRLRNLKNIMLSARGQTKDNWHGSSYMTFIWNFFKKQKKKTRKQRSVCLKLEVGVEIHCTQARGSFFDENILKLDHDDNCMTTYFYEKKSVNMYNE